MSEEKRTLTLEDFWQLKTVVDPQPSPDGTQVAYVVGSHDEGKNEANTAIWLASLESGQCRQLTSGESQDMQSRWSPDGSQLAFVSIRHEGKPQLFLIKVTGGETQCLTSVVDGATSPFWSPDGKQLCYTSMPDTDRQKVAKRQLGSRRTAMLIQTLHTCDARRHYSRASTHAVISSVAPNSFCSIWTMRTLSRINSQRAILTLIKRLGRLMAR